MISVALNNSVFLAQLQISDCSVIDLNFPNYILTEILVLSWKVGVKAETEYGLKLINSFLVSVCGSLMVES